MVVNMLQTVNTKSVTFYFTFKEFSMLAEIPIEFDYEGEYYKGHFEGGEGGGGNVWHLIINKYYNGQLVYSQTYGWAFYNNSGKMKELSEFFGEYVTLWYE
jgi:hypothetical protein